MNLRQRNLVEDGLRQGGAQTCHFHKGAGQTIHLQGDAQGAYATQGGNAAQGASLPKEGQGHLRRGKDAWLGRMRRERYLLSWWSDPGGMLPTMTFLHLNSQNGC